MWRRSPSSTAYFDTVKGKWRQAKWWVPTQYYIRKRDISSTRYTRDWLNSGKCTLGLDTFPAIHVFSRHMGRWIRPVRIQDRALEFQHGRK